MAKKSQVPKKLNDGDPWMLAENIPDSDIFFFQIPLTCFTFDKSYKFIKSYSKSMTDYRGFQMDFYFGEKNSYEVGESIMQALLTRPSFGDDVNRNIVKWSYNLIDYSDKVKKTDLTKFSNEQLWRLYEEHDNVHTKLYTYGWLSVSVDVFHGNFTKRLKQYLFGVCESKEEAEQAFIALTTPGQKSIMAIEQEEFLKIYKQHRKDLSGKKVGEKLKAAVSRHQKKWGHLGYIYAGNQPPFTVQHYLKELRDLARSNVNAAKVLAESAKQLRKARAARLKFVRRLKIDSLHKRLFRVATDFAETKLIRRHAQLYTLLILHNTLLTEIAARLKASRYEIQFMIKDEVREALRKGSFDRKQVGSRMKNCVMYAESGLEVVWTGKQMQQVRKTLVKKIKKNLSEVAGQTAQPGVARGKVKIVIRSKDMKKMNKGDILVSIATDPDIVPAMKKAAAIVTEQGGITSHAAIVSRELGTPCVIGTKIATKVFKDGDMVEVDANKAVVRKI